MPVDVSKSTSTRTEASESQPPLWRLAKKRMLGWLSPTQIAGLVAEAPAGRDSECESPDPPTL